MTQGAGDASKDTPHVPQPVHAFLALLQKLMRVPIRDVEVQGRDIARQATIALVPIDAFISAYRATILKAGAKDAIPPEALQRADQLLALVLEGYDRALREHDRYTAKLREEVLERRRREKQMQETQLRTEREIDAMREDMRLQTAFQVGQTLEQTKLQAQFKSHQREQADLIYALSHDLKSPTQTVLMLLDMFREDHSGKEVDFSLIGLSESTISRMQLMLESLRSLALAVDTDPIFEPLDLNTIVGDVIDDIQNEVVSSGAETDVGPLPAMEGIGFQMRHLFKHLLSNAIKFRHADRPVKITVRDVGHEHSSRVRLEISDNGIGIAPAYHESVFRLFNRLHTYEDYPGSGLGLALCTRIAQNHNGAITLRSQLGAGATFEVSLARQARRCPGLA